MDKMLDREFATPSPTKATWELGWQAPDNILKIEVFDNNRRNATTRKGASEFLRQKVMRMEASMALDGRRQSRKSVTFDSKYHPPGKLLDSFRRIVRSVMLLLRCFRMRKRIAVQSGELTFTHQIQTVDMSVVERSSISWEIRMILCTPPDLRTEKDVKKVTSFLRANGAIRTMLGPTSHETEDKFGGLVAYESYENGRVLAQQGRSPDRFYYVTRGKILVVKEYHVGNSVISKTVAVLTKGKTTSVDEMERNCSERKQSLVCRGTVECFVLDREDYYALREDKTDGAKEFLSQHRILKLFPSELLNNQHNIIDLQYYPKDSVVYPGGADYEWLYVIKTGDCRLVRTQYVADVFCRKGSLFNKQNSQELGCAKNRRYSRIQPPLAAFKMYQPIARLNTAPAYTTRNQQAATTEHIPGLNNEQRLSRSAESFTKEETLKDIEKLANGTSHSKIQNSKTDIKDDIISSSVTFPDVTAGSQSFHNRRTKQPSRPVPRSAPASYRRAHLELGRLKVGDVYGLDDLIGNNEDVTRIALLSRGADVIRIKRSFFLRHAPASLLIQLNALNHDFPTVTEARAALEATETWQMYKSALMELVATSNRTERETFRSQSASTIRPCSFINGRLPGRCVTSQRTQRGIPSRDNQTNRSTNTAPREIPTFSRRKNTRSAYSAPITRSDQITLTRRGRFPKLSTFQTEFVSK
ncbi:uncharacterized protein LOC494407 isoform X2 [Ciona intestinalis]